MTRVQILNNVKLDKLLSLRGSDHLFMFWGKPFYFHGNWETKIKPVPSRGEACTYGILSLATASLWFSNIFALIADRQTDSVFLLQIHSYFLPEETFNINCWNYRSLASPIVGPIESNSRKPSKSPVSFFNVAPDSDTCLCLRHLTLIYFF